MITDYFNHPDREEIVWRDYTIAIDPGSHESGVALYHQCDLKLLVMMDLFDLASLFTLVPEVTYVMEDVKANGFIYGRNQHASKAAAAKISQNVGEVKNTQTQIQLAMSKAGVTPVLIKPTKGNWGTISAKLGRQMLQEVTGWNGSSNKDTRSAAYLGCLYAMSKKRQVPIMRPASDFDWRAP